MLFMSVGFFYFGIQECFWGGSMHLFGGDAFLKANAAKNIFVQYFLKCFGVTFGERSGRSGTTTMEFVAEVCNSRIYAFH